MQTHTCRPSKKRSSMTAFLAIASKPVIAAVTTAFAWTINILKNRSHNGKTTRFHFREWPLIQNVILTMILIDLTWLLSRVLLKVTTCAICLLCRHIILAFGHLPIGYLIANPVQNSSGKYQSLKMLEISLVKSHFAFLGKVRNARLDRYAIIWLFLHSNAKKFRKKFLHVFAT